MFADLELDRRLQLGLEGLAFEAPTEVQAAVVPLALAGKDLSVSAETGSGKTMAYLVPVAQRILGAPSSPAAGTLAVILVPTRELARQVLKHCRDLLRKSPLTAQAITGGADFRYQQSLLRKDPEIIIATPGRLLEHCQRGSAKLDTVIALVLDEADRMLDLGFREEVSQLSQLCPDSKQVMMFSATRGHPGVATVARTLLKSAQEVSLGEQRRAHDAVHHQRILADNIEHKDKLLVALLQAGGYQRALVFANKRTTASRLAGLLSHHALRCGCLHGELSTEERKHVMAQFRDDKIDILSASDVAARGIDVPGIDLVVNYDLPHSGDDYVHRTGRTGRAGATGLAVSLVSPPEWNLMISISRYLQLEFEKRALPGLKARYNGPKKQKSSGKAAGPKKKRKPNRDKSKTRARNQKNRGKRRSSGENTGNDGFAPLTRKKSSD